MARIPNDCGINKKTLNKIIKMKIACIGWGSLIWDPRELKIGNDWNDDGPMLPVEFTRISSDKRVTLIIDKQAKRVRTLWTLNIRDRLNLLGSKNQK